MPDTGDVSSTAGGGGSWSPAWVPPAAVPPPPPTPAKVTAKGSPPPCPVFDPAVVPPDVVLPPGPPPVVPGLVEQPSTQPGGVTGGDVQLSTQGRQLTMHGVGPPQLTMQSVGPPVQLVTHGVGVLQFSRHGVGPPQLRTHGVGPPQLRMQGVAGNDVGGTVGVGHVMMGMQPAGVGVAVGFGVGGRVTGSVGSDGVGSDGVGTGAVGHPTTGRHVVPAIGPVWIWPLWARVVDANANIPSNRLVTPKSTAAEIAAMTNRGQPCRPRRLM